MTDEEFVHYQDLLNDDPVVRELCRIIREVYISRKEVDEMEEKLTEALDDADYYKDSNTELRTELNFAKRTEAALREKLQMWEILKDTDL
jgi:hypothetical protein